MSINKLQIAKEYALTRGGECLSHEYINIRTKLQWKCINKKHEPWFALYDSVLENKNTWCPECNRDKLKLKNGLEKAKEYARSKNGQCLSGEYINSKTKLQWKCSNSKHKFWLSSYTSVVHSQTWCPLCAKDIYDNSTTRLLNSLNKAHIHAQSKKGLCLTENRLNGQNKLEWKCHDINHKSWFASYNNIVNLDSWCPECSKASMIKKKTLSDSLEKAQAHAKSKLGLCLSTECFNSNSILKWKCLNENHEFWLAKYTNVLRGNWCPQCSQEKKNKQKTLTNGLDNANICAINKGGKCLSTIYINSTSKMEWKCHDINHKSWFSKYSHVVSGGTWCPECGIAELTQAHTLKEGLDNAKKHALSKGGNCLSIECINSADRLEWKCSNEKHASWFATYSSVLNNGSWCRQCRIDSDFPKEKYLKIANETATSKNGKCLSREYINNHTKMEWKCHENSHPSWKSIYTSVVNGGCWCPICANAYSIKEFKVQQILNYIFDTKFVKNKSLNWNVNPRTNYKLELDGYSNELKIAFEFQGRHHFEENIFKNTKLKDVQYRDEIKKENCYLNGIQLIIVNEIKKNKCLLFFEEILIGIKNAGISIPIYNYVEVERLYKLTPQKLKK